MNKQEAIQAMAQGKKVTHMLFTPKEWITMKEGQIHFEDGFFCSMSEFWGIRENKEWDDGYSLFNDVQNVQASVATEDDSSTSAKSKKENKLIEAEELLRNALNTLQFTKSRLVYLKMSTYEIDSVIEEFESYLEEYASIKGEAVEFAEWADFNGWNWNYHNQNWWQIGKPDSKTSAQLFELYKQQSTTN